MKQNFASDCGWAESVCFDGMLITTLVSYPILVLVLRHSYLFYLVNREENISKDSFFAVIGCKMYLLTSIFVTMFGHCFHCMQYAVQEFYIFWAYFVKLSNIVQHCPTFKYCIRSEVLCAKAEICVHADNWESVHYVHFLFYHSCPLMFNQTTWAVFIEGTCAERWQKSPLSSWIDWLSIV